jgi:hypothetical protein
LSESGPVQGIQPDEVDPQWVRAAEALLQVRVTADYCSLAACR